MDFVRPPHAEQTANQRRLSSTRKRVEDKRVRQETPIRHLYHLKLYAEVRKALNREATLK